MQISTKIPLGHFLGSFRPPRQTGTLQSVWTPRGKKKKAKKHICEGKRKKKNLDSYDPQIEKLSDLAVICLGWTLMGHFLMCLGFSAGLLP